MSQSHVATNQDQSPDSQLSVQGTLLGTMVNNFMSPPTTSSNEHDDHDGRHQHQQVTPHRQCYTPRLVDSARREEHMVGTRSLPNGRIMTKCYSVSYPHHNLCLPSCSILMKLV
jgi:hypothetical protein